MRGHRIAIACGLIALSFAAQAITWNAANEFSTTQNPSGPWGYYEQNGSSVVACSGSFSGGLPFVGWYGASGQGLIMKNVAAYGAYNIQSGHLSLECDYGAPVLRFTAPFESFFDIFLEIGGPTYDQNGGYGNVSAYFGAMRINGVDIASDSFTDNLRHWSKSQVHLLAGDKIEAHMNGSHWGGGNTDTMMIVSTVPEPATWLIWGAGLAALGLRRRSR